MRFSRLRNWFAVSILSSSVSSFTSGFSLFRILSILIVSSYFYTAYSYFLNPYLSNANGSSSTGSISRCFWGSSFVLIMLKKHMIKNYIVFIIYMPAKKKAVSLLLTIKLLNNCFVKKTCKSKSDFLIGRGLYNIRARTESGPRTLSCTAYRHLLQYFYIPYCSYLSVHTAYCTLLYYLRNIFSSQVAIIVLNSLRHTCFLYSIQNVENLALPQNGSPKYIYKEKVEKMLKFF
jgi:hypothetical protein